MKSTITALIFSIGVLSFTGVGAQPALKQAFKDDFLIGAALNESQFCESNSVAVAIIKTQFNSISPENVLKWENIHPQPGRFEFGMADKYVDFGVRNGMFIIGHNLIWHAQTPDWVFQDAKGNPVTREVLLQRMRDHIFSVVGRYQGRIQGWDVVNEALAEDGTLRESSWKKIIGEDYLIKAFEYAHEADPNAELYYNDYSLENAPKRAGAIALVKKLRAAGVHLAGIGVQSHIDLDWPSLAQETATITAFGELGLKVMITELDVDVLPKADYNQGADVSRRVAEQAALNPFADGLPEARQQALAQRYADLFAVFVKHSDIVQRVTFWGVTDGDSWLNGWPVTGRTSYPLLFDRAGKPKPAFLKVLETASPKQAGKKQAATSF